MDPTVDLLFKDPGFEFSNNKIIEWTRFPMINLEIPTLYFQIENSWKGNKIWRDKKDLEKPVLSEIFVSGTVIIYSTYFPT